MKYGELLPRLEKLGITEVSRENRGGKDIVVFLGRAKDTTVPFPAKIHPVYLDIDLQYRDLMVAM